MNARLITCANYFPIESMFWFEGFLTHSEEYVTIYKTKSENWEIIKSTIEKSHKNKVPCIIKLATVEANESYENWIQAETHTH